MKKDGTEVRELAMPVSSGKVFPDKKSQCKDPRARGFPVVLGARCWNKVLSRNEVREVTVGTR